MALELTTVVPVIFRRVYRSARRCAADFFAPGAGDWWSSTDDFVLFRTILFAPAMIPRFWARIHRRIIPFLVFRCLPKPRMRPSLEVDRRDRCSSIQAETLVSVRAVLVASFVFRCGPRRRGLSSPSAFRLAFLVLDRRRGSAAYLFFVLGQTIGDCAAPSGRLTALSNTRA